MQKKMYLALLLFVFTITVSINPNVFSQEAINTANDFTVGELTEKTTASPEDVFYNYLDTHQAKFGFHTAAKNNFRVFHRETRPEGGTFLKLQQTWNGIPVYKSLIKTHIRNNGILHAISGKMIPNLDKFPGLAKTPALTQTVAIEIAAADLVQNSGGVFHTIQSGLYIYANNQDPVLAYVVELRPEAPLVGRWRYVVDALTGRIIRKSNAVVYDGGTIGSCYGVLNDLKYINIKYEDAKSRYIMDDETRSYAAIHSMTAYNGIGLDFANSKFTTFYRAEDKPAADAHYYGGKVLDYYKNTPFNRNSYDNNGATLITQSNMGGFVYNNAGWDGVAISIGETDGYIYLPFSGAIECIGHEFTHAVFESETQCLDSDYYGESGAVNEAIADIFGALIENYYNYADPWISCEDVYTPNIAGDGGIRSMSNPPSCNYNDGTGAKPYPDHYDNRYTGTYDNSGVHINSSIINKAAYLICQGGTHHGYTVTGIGPAKTGWLFYRTLCDYVIRTETFNDLYAHTLQKAVDLYGSGSAEWTAVKNAFNAVGLPNTYQPTYGPFGHGSGGSGLRIDETQTFHENNYDVTVNVNGSSMIAVWADLYQKQGTSWIKCGSTHSCTGGPMFWAGVGPGDYKLEIHYIYPYYGTGYCTYTIH